MAWLLSIHIQFSVCELMTQLGDVYMYMMFVCVSWVINRICVCVSGRVILWVYWIGCSPLRNLVCYLCICVTSGCADVQIKMYDFNERFSENTFIMVVQVVVYIFYISRSIFGLCHL